MSYDCHQIATALSERYGKRPKLSGDNWTTNCPCHDDQNGSLSIKEDKGKLLVCCQAGCNQKELFDKVIELSGIKNESKSKHKNRTIKSVYSYKDASGNTIFEKVRYVPKDFLSRRPDGNGGYIWSTKDVDTSIPYRLPEILRAIQAGESIWIVEGEKDCDKLLSIGLVATCNLQGASTDGKAPKWTDKHTTWLTGINGAVILPDNDDAGRAHARAIAESLTRAGIKCKVVELPGLSEKGDVSDWLAAGGTKEQLLESAANTEAWIDEEKKPDSGQADGNNSDYQNTGRQKSSREVLIGCMNHAQFWQDEESNAYASFVRKGHLEHHKVKSSAFRKILVAECFKQTNKGVSGTALQEAIATLEARATISDLVYSPSLRFGEYEGNLYLDLCDKDWNVIKIDATGFCVVRSDQCPVRFIRRKSMQTLPIPMLSNNLNPLEDLRILLNVDQTKWRLIVSCVISCLRPNYPLPVMALRGEQGSGKTTLLKLLRELIDPNKSNTRKLPKDEETLFIAMANSACLVFENVSSIPLWLSDTFCSISTGGGFANRKLYENDEENIFEGTRAIWIDGISNFVTRPDLAERTITIDMQKIDETGRKTIEQIRDWFNVNKAALLANLLVIVSGALEQLPNVALDKLPRMADFAKFACAAAPNIGWTDKDFLSAFTADKQNEQANLVDNSLVARLIKKMLDAPDSEAGWSGIASELLAKLCNWAGTDKEKAALPKTPNILSTELRRLAPALRSVGIDVTSNPNTKHGTKFSIQKIVNKTPQILKEEFEV